MTSPLSANESLKKTVCDYKSHIAQITALQRDTSRCLSEIQTLINSSRGSGQLFSLPALQVPDFNFTNRLPCVLFTGKQNCGKTTLLNVFLGKHILPTHETPCTARLVRMVHSLGDENYVTLVDPQGNKQSPKTFRIGKTKDLKEYIVLKDEDRQDIEKLKSIVEVGVKDIKLLECGIELIDSPGRNENEALDRVVEEFVEKGVVPLIVYVVDGNYHLQKTDRTTIRELQNKFPNVTLMFVCSKVDVDIKANKFDKDEEDGEAEDTALDPFDEKLFAQAQRKKFEVFQQLKNLEFLPSDAEIGSCSLYHGISSKLVKLSRKGKLKNAATMSFEHLELCIFEQLESSLRRESKRVLSTLLSAQEMILTSVVDKQRTLSATVSSLPIAYQRAVDMELSVFTMILDLIVKGKSITNVIGTELEKLAVIFTKEGEQYQFTTKSQKRKALTEEFCSEMKDSILDRTFNVLKRSISRALRTSLYQSVLNVERITEAVGEALIPRLMERIYSSQYHQRRRNNRSSKDLVEKCVILEGVLESFKNVVDVALRKEISKHLDDLDLKQVGPCAKPKDSSWRRKVVQTLLSNIDCNRLTEAVVKTCEAALSRKHKEFTQDVKKFHSLNEVLSAAGVESVISRLRSDYVPQVAELAVKGHALQYIIERGGPPQLGELVIPTAHGQVHSCFSPLWCAESDRCMVKVVTKSAVGSEVWNQTMRDCMHTIDISQKLGRFCPYLLQLNGWFFPEPEKLYIVMEEAVEDLLTALRRGMTWEKRLDVAVDVAKGIAAIHKTHYVYQDLKPQNVMLTANGTAKVNLCKPEKPLETTKLGIPFHISPKMFESYRKDQYAELSYDIYAFGSLLWVLCEGSGHTSPQVYSHCHDIEAMQAAVCDDKIRPDRPQETPDALWELMTSCWRDDVVFTIQNVLQHLLRIQSSIFPSRSD